MVLVLVSAVSFLKNSSLIKDNLTNQPHPNSTMITQIKHHALIIVVKPSIGPLFLFMQKFTCYFAFCIMLSTGETQKLPVILLSETTNIVHITICFTVLFIGHDCDPYSSESACYLQLVAVRIAKENQGKNWYDKMYMINTSTTLETTKTNCLQRFFIS